MTDSSLARATRASRFTGAAAPPYLSQFAWPAAFLLMIAMLLVPALWNGFPFIFADTGGYLARPYLHQLDLGRSALYGLFLALGVGFDFWPVVLVQAVVCAW